MELHEKIRHLREKRKLTQEDLLNKIRELFPGGAISRRTLQRIEAGQTDGRASSLHQICGGLDVTVDQLLADVEKREITGFTRWDTYRGDYVYNNGAVARLMSGREMPFLCMKLCLKPKSATRLEKDPDEKSKYIKWVYVLRGALTLHVEEQIYVMKQTHCATFFSTQPHYFENATSKDTICIIMQYPRHI